MYKVELLPRVTDHAAKRRPRARKLNLSEQLELNDRMQAAAEVPRRRGIPKGLSRNWYGRPVTPKPPVVSLFEGLLDEFVFPAWRAFDE